MAASVLVVMGSASDAEVMRAACEELKALGIGYEATVASVHRTPERATELARGARSRGIKVIIAGAGCAAHLAGALAAQTTLPVIGVPLDSSPLSGLDALLSTVQMPPGIPVATMAVGAAGARNAAVLAAQILALSDESLAARLEERRRWMAESVEKSAESLDL